MVRKTLLVSLTFCGVVVILLALAWQLRQPLAIAVARRVLAANQLTLTRVESLQLHSNSAAVAELELLFRQSGQRLQISNLALNFNLHELYSTGMLRSLTVDAVTLVHPDAAPEQQPEAATQPVLLGEVLQQLQNFPVATVAISTLTLPQWQETISATLQHSVATSVLQISSGQLQLQATLEQPDPQQTAQLQLALTLATTPVATVTLTARPDNSGFTLTGGGQFQLPLVNMLLVELGQNPLATSVTAADVQWELAAQLADDALGSPLSAINLSIGAGSTLTLAAGQIDGLGELTVLSSNASEVVITPDSTFTVTAGNIDIQLDGSWQGQAFSADAQLVPAACQLLGERKCTVAFTASARLAEYELSAAAAVTPATAVAPVSAAVAPAPTRLTNLALNGSGTVVLDSTAVQLELAPDFKVTTGAVTANNFSLQGLSATNKGALSASSSLDAKRVQLRATQLTAELAGFAAGQYGASSTLQLRDIVLDAADVIKAAFAVQTSNLEVTGLQSWLPAVELDAVVGLNGPALDFTSTVELREAPQPVRIAMSGKHDLATGGGSANIKLPQMDFTGEGASLSSYMREWPYAFDVMTGTAEAELTAHWEPGLVSATGGNASSVTMNMQASLDDMAGYYNDIFFAGLAAKLTADIDLSASQPLSTPPQTLTLTNLDVGVPISNIVLNYQLDSATHMLTVTSVTGELLGGTVSSDDIRYDFNSERNLVNLDFDGFRLDRMLELAEYEGVQASGAVSGRLPVTITSEGVEVEAGTLIADQGGGLIRYLDGVAAGASGNAALDLMNQALSNYVFESLDSSIDYTPDGELLLAMKLQGHNPDMNNGQRINLNLNLSDNIPVLLKSLQTGRAIEDFLQEQYKQ